MDITSSGPIVVRIARIGWLLLVVATVSLYLLRQVADGPYGKDFTMFLTGARMVIEGEGVSLYDLDAQARVQAEVKGPYTYPGGVLPFNYPPYVAIVLSPLALLSPDLAYYVWVVLQFAMLIALALSIRRVIGGKSSLPMLMLFAFAPVYEALLMGQMSLVLVLLWWGAFLSWRNGNAITLGIAISLLAFKPQMALLLVVALLVQRQWRALAWAAATQAVLWGAAILLFGPDILVSYLDALRLSGTTTGTLGFYPEAMTNLRGLLTALGAEPDLGLQLSFGAWLLSIAVVGWMWWRGLRSLAVRFGVTAVLAALLSPHLYIHDASLLIIAPLCLYVAAQEQGDLREMNWLLIPFAAVFVALYLPVLSIVPSFTPLILATLLCGSTILALLMRLGSRVEAVHLS